MSARARSFAGARCRVCGWEFRYDAGTSKNPKPAPASCGLLACRARQEWGPDEWAGRARMATARERAGVALDDLDREALARTAPAARPNAA